MGDISVTAFKRRPVELFASCLFDEQKLESAVCGQSSQSAVEKRLQIGGI